MVGYRILAGLVDRVRIIVALLAAASPRSSLLLPRRVVGVRVGRVRRRRVGWSVTWVRRRRWCLVRPFCEAEIFKLLQDRVVARSHLLGELGSQGGEV